MGRGGRVAAVVTAAGVLGAGAWWWLDESTGPADPCAARTSVLEPGAAELVPVGELTPAGSVGGDRRPVVEAVDGVAPGLGRAGVVAGRFFPPTTGPPALVSLDAAAPGTLLLARAPAADHAGTLTAVRLPGGLPSWARTFTGSTPGGGLVGDLLVTVLGPEEQDGRVLPPAVLSLDPADGTVVACVAPAIDRQLLDGDLRMLADQAGPDVVVAAVSPGRAVTLSRVDPADGRVVWGRQTDGFADAATVTVTGPEGLVVLSRLGHDPVRLVEEAAATGAGAGALGPVGPDGPGVTAYSVADGARAWAYPPAGDGSAVMVLGADAATGTTVVVAARRAAGSQAFPRVRLVALDADGVPLWSRALGRGFWDGELWGSTVVLRGPDPRGPDGSTVLRAHDLADGRPRWTIRSATLPRRGPEPREGFGAGVAVGEGYAVPAPNGLVLVDPASGRTTRLDSDVSVDQLLPLGEHLVVRAGGAVLVLGG